MNAGHTTERALDHDGRARTYLLHVPSQVEERLPLVIALHGGMSNGAATERLTSLSPLADRERFVVAYPDGVEGTWNDGRELETFPAMRDGVDDIGFLGCLIDELVDAGTVDARRVYVTGISNGGHMTHRVGAELSDRVAAIAPVAASMPTLVHEKAQPSVPLGVILFFGTEDPLNFWDGGGFAGGSSPPVPEIIRWWARHNGQSGEPEVESLPVSEDDGTSVRRESFGSGVPETVLYAIEGGGHTWPGGPQYRPVDVIGRGTKNLDASAVMWSHFQRHHR